MKVILRQVTHSTVNLGMRRWCKISISPVLARLKETFLSDIPFFMLRSMRLRTINTYYLLENGWNFNFVPHLCIVTHKTNAWDEPPCQLIYFWVPWTDWLTSGLWTAGQKDLFFIPNKYRISYISSRTRLAYFTFCSE